MSTIQVVVHGDSMWPSHRHGEVIECQRYEDQELSVGDIVVAPHPLKRDVQVVKRIAAIQEDGRLMLSGDNPDPLASEDSHNFGPVRTDSIIAYRSAH